MAATTDVTKAQAASVDVATEVLAAPVDAENKRRVSSPVWSHFVKRKIDGLDKA